MDYLKSQEEDIRAESLDYEELVRAREEVREDEEKHKDGEPCVCLTCEEAAKISREEARRSYGGLEYWLWKDRNK
jgi:hypothetical protein